MRVPYYSSYSQLFVINKQSLSDQHFQAFECVLCLQVLKINIVLLFLGRLVQQNVDTNRLHYFVLNIMQLTVLSSIIELSNLH